MATNESIEIPEGLEISSKNKDQYKDIFLVKIKVRLSDSIRSVI